MSAMVPSPSFTPPASLIDCTAAVSTASELTPNERNGPDLAPQPAILTVRSAAADTGCVNTINAAAATPARAAAERLAVDMVESSV